MKSQLPFLKIWTKYPDLKRQPNKIFLQPLMVFPNICQIQRKNSKPKLLIKNGTQCLFMHNVMVSCLTNYESVSQVRFCLLKIGVKIEIKQILFVVTINRAFLCMRNPRSCHAGLVREIFTSFYFRNRAQVYQSQIFAV